LQPEDSAVGFSQLHLQLEEWPVGALQAALQLEDWPVVGFASCLQSKDRQVFAEQATLHFFDWQVLAEQATLHFLDWQVFGPQVALQSEDRKGLATASDLQSVDLAVRLRSQTCSRRRSQPTAGTSSIGPCPRALRASHQARLHPVSPKQHPAYEPVKPTRTPKSLAHHQQANPPLATLANTPQGAAITSAVVLPSTTPPLCASRIATELGVWPTA
jgi:hypothetical protein